MLTEAQADQFLDLPYPAWVYDIETLAFLAVNDFGTGYNSMVNLKRLPVHALKIDRTFISEMLDSPFDFALVEAMIGLGKRLGLDIVAEGIETTQQASAVISLRALALQGFLMARPMPSDEFARFYRTRHA